MAADKFTPVTITITLARSAEEQRIIATTWGTIGGKYGSLGRVSFPSDVTLDPVNRPEMARIILTALYGLPYDL